MHYQDYTDREQDVKKYRAHQGSQASKNRRRNNESKGQVNNVNFEQGGRLDDEEKDQSLYDDGGYKEEAITGRHKDTEKSKTRGASDIQRNEENDDAQNDQQTEDLINYKGIYFNDNNEKYIDDSTGAHFRYDDIFQRLLIAKVERNRMDKELNISYSSQNDDINDYQMKLNHNNNDHPQQQEYSAQSKDKTKRRSLKSDKKLMSKIKTNHQTIFGQKKDSVDK